MSNIILKQGDCLELMKELPDESVDAVITSPPYNVDLGNNKFNSCPYDLYNDNKEHKEYIKWLREIFDLLFRKLVKGGRVCINIGDGKNGAVPTQSDIIQTMKEIGYIPLTHIIWDKKNVANRTAWGSFASPSSPSFPTPFEHILIFCKETNKLQKEGTADITNEEFIKWTLAIWEFTGQGKEAYKNGKLGTPLLHPAAFPIELPYRLIKLLTYKSDTILDPFMGSGTTGVACVQLNRNFIGYEISPDYFKIAEKRINEAKAQKKLGIYNDYQNEEEI